MKIEGRVAWISGGAQGIGLTVAERLVIEGVKVVLVDMCDTEKGEKAAKHLNEIGKKGGEAKFFRADMSDFSQLRASMDVAKDMFGQFATIVFNNAGIVVGDKDKRWQKMLEVNTLAVIEGQHYAISLIRKHCKDLGGVVVNTASVAGLGPVPLTPAYAASKWAVVGFTASSLMEKQKSNTRVVCLCPAVTNTPAVGEFFKDTLVKVGMESEAKKALDTERIAEAFMTLVLNDKYHGTVCAVTPDGAFDVPMSLQQDYGTKKINPTPRL